MIWPGCIRVAKVSKAELCDAPESLINLRTRVESVA